MTFSSKWECAKDDSPFKLTVSTNRNSGGTDIYSLTIVVSDSASGMGVEIAMKDALALDRWLRGIATECHF